MKAKFTFLVMLFLLTTSIYALGPTRSKSDKLTGNILKNRLERTEESTNHHLFHRKRGYQKQGNSLKSAQAIKQRLDSYSYQELEDETFEKGKGEYIYDANGMLTNEREYYWDEATGIMVFLYQSETTYDTRKNKIQYVTSYMDETTNQFIVESKETYSYDSNGVMIQSIVYQPNDDLIFIQDDKTDYTYDSNGKLIQEISSRFDESTNQFVFSNKVEYNYNGNGQESEQVYSTWDSYTSEQWEPNTKYEYTYDSQGNLILFQESNRTDVNNTWIWSPNSKQEFTYNQKGLLIQILEYDIVNDSQWELDDKEVYIYDDYDNNTENFFYYNWDVQTSEWGDVYKSENTYDNRYTFNDLILPWGDEEYTNNFFGHMLTDIRDYGWNISTNEWIMEYEVAFAYSPVNVTSEDQLKAGITSVYPNPFSESISFSTSGSYSQISFELFDFQGRKLMSKAIGSNEKINMQGLNSGMYVYKLNLDGKLQSGKLVKN